MIFGHVFRLYIDESINELNCMDEIDNLKKINLNNGNVHLNQINTCKWN
jgi:hypothetical protein